MFHKILIVLLSRLDFEKSQSRCFFCKDVFVFILITFAKQTDTRDQSIQRAMSI